MAELVIEDRIVRESLIQTILPMNMLLKYETYKFPGKFYVKDKTTKNSLGILYSPKSAITILLALNGCRWRKMVIYGESIYDVSIP